MRTDEEIDKLVNDNMPLAYFLAGKWSERLGHDAALSTAMDGLLVAATTWDASFGIPFGTYAGMRIDWKLIRARLPMTREKRGAGVIHFPLDYELESGAQLHEIIAAPEPEDNTLDRDLPKTPVSKLMLQLSQKERFVLILRFGLNGSAPRSLEDVSNALRVTKERVRQIEFKALKKLRHKFQSSLTE